MSKNIITGEENQGPGIAGPWMETAVLVEPSNQVPENENASGDLEENLNLQGNAGIHGPEEANGSDFDVEGQDTIDIQQAPVSQILPTAEAVDADEIEAAIQERLRKALGPPVRATEVKQEKSVFSEYRCIFVVWLVAVVIVIVTLAVALSGNTSIEMTEASVIY